jgi:cytosine/adenosine deaminase-related metal-dependent hydrolase
MLREHWPGDGPPFSRQRDPAWLADAAAHAAADCLDQGVTHVANIAHHPDLDAATRAAGLQGITFVELIGHAPSPPASDRPAHALLRDVARHPSPHLGLQPHAPYSAGPALYGTACRIDLPLTTHLAENPEELAFVASATGPFRDLLERIGKWHPAIASAYAAGQTPVQWMLPHLRRRPWLLAHANYLTDADLDALAALPPRDDDPRPPVSVAYCPIASDYFGHRDHRYRDLLAAGVNVCLGTDSIVCQPPPEDSHEKWQPYAMLNQMRHLHRRDATDPATLMRMATTHAATALGLTGLDFTRPYASVPIDPDDPADPLTQALRTSAPLTPLSPHAPATSPS